MHHIVHCIDCVSPLFVGVCPISVDDVPTMSSMTPMKNYTIFRSARQAKPPCSFRYNPTLSLLLSFIALGQFSTLICHIIHSLVHCIDCVLSFFAGGCSPLVDVCSDDEFDDTDDELYYL